MAFRKIKGTTDFYPQEQYIQDTIFRILTDVATRYGYQHVEPPVVESIELLTAKSGDEIKKQIFTIEKKGQEELGLRFEFTAGLARMVVEKQKALQKPIKWYSLNKVWRYERPQAGREREFFQFNVECYGSDNAEADAEIMNLAIDSLLALGLQKKDFYLRINNRKLLFGLLEGIAGNDRIPDIMRVIDKKDKISVQEFEEELSFLPKAQIESIKRMLSLTWDGLKEYKMNDNARLGFDELAKVLDHVDNSVARFDITVARGLDYYTGCVFEVFDTNRKFRALCGGGRYDSIIEVFGGTPMPATGFGMGYSTILLLLEDKGLLPKHVSTCDYFIAVLDDAAKGAALGLCRKLRRKHTVMIDLMGRSLQKQLKFASQVGAKKIIFIGPDEVKAGKAKIKDPLTDTTEVIDLNQNI